MVDNYCNNCGKMGHLFHQCKIPITSFGVILFRIFNKERQYLMIRRKDTLGFIDFMRGKYSVNNRHYIMNMLKQMTNSEKTRLCSQSFDEIWREIWCGESISSQYKSEEIISRDKFSILQEGIYVHRDFYNIRILVEESNTMTCWEEPEWGFPKGRRNYQEKDYDCAMREMTEETGYSHRLVKNIMNILPFEEIFTGSNYKSYKHKYFVAYLEYSLSMETVGFEKSEVSSMKWKTLSQCMECIRPYNLEKKRVINNVDAMISNVSILSSVKSLP